MEYIHYFRKQTTGSDKEGDISTVENFHPEHSKCLTLLKF